MTAELIASHASALRPELNDTDDDDDDVDIK